MTIARVNGSSWGANAKLTSAQANALDLNATFALDKRSGQTDTLESTVSVTGDIDIDSGGFLAINNGAFMTCGLGSTVHITSTAAVSLFNTATLTFNDTSALAFAGTSSAEFRTGTHATFDDNSTLTVASGANLVVHGTEVVYGVLATDAASTTAIAGAAAFTGATTATDFTMLGTARVKLASRSITRVCELEPKSQDLTAWAPDVDMQWLCKTTSATALQLPIHVPSGATLTGVSVTFQPNTGHTGLPSIMPSLSLWKSAAGVVTQLGSTTTDSSGTTGVYETKHSLAVSGVSEVTNRSGTRYYAILTSEGSTHAVANTALFETKVTYTTTAYDED